MTKVHNENVTKNYVNIKLKNSNTALKPLYILTLKIYFKINRYFSLTRQEFTR